MNWTKLAYHSFLTILLGVTLSVCSNVMETDDFEIEAIANSSNVKYGSATVASGENEISFASNFTKIPVVFASRDTGDNASAVSTDRIIKITKSGFTYNCCGISGVNKIYYSAIGN